MSLTRKDLLAVDNLFTKRVTSESTPIRQDIKDLGRKFGILQTSVDKYLKRTENWHAEFQVLDARVSRMKTVLVNKGIATEDEFALIHE